MNNRVVNRTIGVILLMVGMVLAGCESPEAPKKVSKSDGLELPIQFALPVNEVSFSSRAQAPLNAPAYDEAGMPAHVMSDPGDQEEFAFPKYLYVFCALWLKGDPTPSVVVKDTMLSDLQREDWTTKMVGNDSMYIYTLPVFIPTDEPKDRRDSVHVYAAVSDVELTLKVDGTAIDWNDPATSPVDEADVHGITFVVDNEIQPHLGNIYSTPCNYKINHHYYGLNGHIKGNVSYLNLVLYHVASKVDVMWNVPNAAARDTVRITGIQARYLFTGDAYLFQPTKNRSDLLASGVDYTISGDNAGQWWAGRNYFYTIPYLINTGTYAGKCPLQLDIKIKDTKSDAEYTDYLKIYKNIPVADTVFVPWMRGQIKVSNPLTADKADDVKVVD